MADIKPIRTAADHEAALARIDVLMGAAPGTAEADELAVLAELVEGYEKIRFPIAPPEPIDAIRFCMEQQGFKPRDLEPYIGARGRVSEVLAGKKPLTLAMIRALHDHLGIPADILLQRSPPPPRGRATAEGPALSDWRRLPWRTMMKRGWIRPVDDLKAHGAALFQDLVDSAGGSRAVPEPLFRRGATMRQNAKADAHALQAWCLIALATARKTTLASRYRAGSIDAEALRSIGRLSNQPDGPRRARSALAELGVHLVCLDHLPRTYLDGAALCDVESGSPVLALTLRHDRLDNFWFCLLHELAHVGRHFTADTVAFIDDLSLRDATVRREDEREAEADQWAEEALVPAAIWRDAGLGAESSFADVIAVAQRAEVHPAVVAGRLRHELRNYRLFSQLLGQRVVRRLLVDS